MAATHEIGRRQYDVRSSRIIPNVLPRILLLDANLNEAGFLAFFSRLKAERTKQEKFPWDVDEYLETSDTTSAAVGATVEDIDVSNPKYFNVGQTWQNSRTGEYIHIQTVSPGLGRIKATRGLTALNSSGGTAAAAMNSGDTLLKRAPAVGEDSRRQATQTTTPTEVFGYSQEYRYDLSFSNRQIKRSFENGMEKDYQMKKSLQDARKDINRAFLFNEKARFTDANTGDTTLTQGIRGVPTTYTWAVGGVMYENDFDEFLVEEGLRKGSQNKIMFASTQLILAITQMTKDRLTYNVVNFQQQKRKIGISVIEYMAPNGRRLMIVEDRNISDDYNGEAYGIDMQELKRRVFSSGNRSGELHIISGTQDKDDLGEINTLYGDMGLQWGVEAAHFKITGVSGGAKGSPVGG